MNNPKLQFWILSRNRPHFLGETLRSAVAQLQPGVEIIVSDNSDNDLIAELVIKEFPDVTLVRRQPVLPALQHFKVILEQACGEYVTLFHDDDVLARRQGGVEHRLRPGDIRSARDRSQACAGGKPKPKQDKTPPRRAAFRGGPATTAAR